MHQIILITVILLLTYLLFHWSCKFRKNRLPLPPSPFKLPFIGNLHQLGHLPHRSLQKLSAKHGPLMLLHLGRVPTLVVSSPAIAEQILKTHDLNFASRPALKVSRFLLYGGRDLILAPYGDLWRHMRKLCATHLLSSRMVQNLEHVRADGVAVLLERITRASAMNVVNKNDVEVAIPVTDILNEFVIDFVYRAVFGGMIKSDSRKKALIELHHEVTQAFSVGNFYAEDFFPGLWWVDVILGLERRLKKQFRKFDALLQGILEEYEQMAEFKGEELVHRTANFAQVLLSLQEEGMLDLPLEKEHIKAILLDMIVAGGDTTSIFLNWIMTELIKNPTSMEKVQQELREKSHVTIGLPLEEKHLSNMNFLKAVIKETFRLHPPVPLLVPRESFQECEIQGYVIPKQTRVLMNVWSIGRDPQTWEAPEEFRPERWLGSIVDYKGQDFQFLPFGAGRRICPGMQFAMAIVEITVANLLYLFDWKLPNAMKGCDVDMSEVPGATTPRKQKLELIAFPRQSKKLVMINP